MKIRSRRTLGRYLRGHPRSAPLWRVVLAVLLAAILYLALSPDPPQQVDLGWDKLNHVAAFAALASVACLAFAFAWRRITLGLLAFGALIEWLQSLTATRDAEWADLLADACGIAIGLLAATALAAALVAWRRSRRHGAPRVAR